MDVSGVLPIMCLYHCSCYYDVLISLLCCHFPATMPSLTSLLLNHKSFYYNTATPILPNSLAPLNQKQFPVAPQYAGPVAPCAPESDLARLGRTGQPPPSVYPGRYLTVGQPLPHGSTTYAGTNPPSSMLVRGHSPYGTEIPAYTPPVSAYPAPPSTQFYTPPLYTGIDAPAPYPNTSALYSSTKGPGLDSGSVPAFNPGYPAFNPGFPPSTPPSAPSIALNDEAPITFPSVDTSTGKIRTGLSVGAQSAPIIPVTEYPSPPYNDVVSSYTSPPGNTLAYAGMHSL